MSQIDTTKEQLVEKAEGFLSGKPIWVWWISYTLLVGILFGLFYLVWTLLTEKWWVISILIPVVGISWSTILYYNKKNTITSKDQ